MDTSCDQQAIAERIVQGLELNPGTTVVVDGNAASRSLMDLLADTCHRSGLVPIQVCQEASKLADYQQAIDAAEAYITCAANYRTMEPQRRALVDERVRQRHIPWAYIDDRYFATAPQAFNFWGRSLKRSAAILEALLVSAQEVRLSSAGGHELRFRVQHDDVSFDNGMRSSADRYRKGNVISWPAGECSLSLSGRNISGSVAVVDDCGNGHVVRESICRVGIGLNPAVPSSIVCKKRIGSIHIGVESWPQQKEEAQHHDLFVVEPTLVADRRVLLEDGQLFIPQYPK